jgi:hypothetical protein
MKKVLFCLAFAAASASLPSYASNVGFSLGINIGNQPNVVVAAPPPAPAYEPPVVIDEPPEFISPPELGFYVAVGVPYDLYFTGNQYYLCRGNVWYAGPRYDGPWAPVRYRALPWTLRRYPHEKIRYYRDAGYRHYRAGGNPYWEKHHFHPDRDWKEHRRAEHRDWKEDRRAERGDWRGDRRDGGDGGGGDNGRHHGRDN